MAVPASPASGHDWSWRDHAATLAVLILVAIVTRFQQIGNPIVHIDEQFYLLVGDRMHSGAVPYVDIWDRKPVGLFVIYWASRFLGGHGIVQYQLVASGFAVATAFVIERIASRLTGPWGARLAGALYLLWIPLLTGQGGQSPVFYNLFMAGAAACVIAAADDGPRRRLIAFGAAAMLLVGIAIQIKYTVVFEGFAFGLALIWLARRAGLAWPHTLLAAAGWAAMALAPTMLALAIFWRIGAFAAFWYANFVSIFERSDLDPDDQIRNAATLSLYLAPLLIFAAAAAKRRWRSADRSFAGMFVTGWLAVAVFAVVIFRYYFDHYGLPIVAPAAASAATLLGRRSMRRWSAALLSGALLACLVLPTLNQRRRGTPAELAALETVLRPYVPFGLLVWDNLPIAYYDLDARLLTRYPFPTHLRDRNESRALGVDRIAEVRRILAARPGVIVIEQGKPRAMVRDTTIILRRRLATDYHRIATVKVGRRDQFVYVLNGIGRATPPSPPYSSSSS